MNIKREKRLNSEFQREIYSILKYKVKNPELTEMFSISEVENKKKATFKAICDSAKFVRTELSKVMRIRTVPELRFLVDTSEEYGNKIDAILSGITYNTENDDEN